MRVLEPRPTQHIRKTYRFKGWRVLIAALGLAICLEILIAVGQSFLSKRAIAQWGIIERSVTVECLILRKETLLVSPMNGEVELAVSAGSRVRRGQLLFKVTNPDLESSISVGNQEKYLELSRRLAEFDRILRGIEREFRIYQNGNKKRGTGSLELERLRAERFRIRRLKQNLMDSEYSGKFADWSRYCRCVFADQAGIFWPALDGGEQLPAGEAYVPSAGDFKRYYETSSPVLAKKVQAEQSVGKLIGGWEETLVAWAKPEELPFRPDEQQQCRLLLSEGDPINLEFIQKITADEGEYWFFQDSSLSQELLKKRKIRGSIVTRRTFGIRIPKSAVRKSKAGWEVRTEKRSIPVKLVDEDDSWAIVKGLDLGTIVLYR